MRQIHFHARSTERRARDRNAPAMPLDHLTGDRQAQSAASGIAISRAVEPIYRLDHGLTLVGRDARPVIVDRHDQPAAFAGQGDNASTAMGESIVDQVAEKPLQRDRIGLQTGIFNFR